MEKPRTSLCQLSFPHTSFSEDLDLAVATGVDGLSVAEAKIIRGEEDRVAGDLTTTGLQTSVGYPVVWTILPPLGGTFPAVPADPVDRVEEMVASIASLARIGVPSVMVCTGPAGDRSEGEARRVVVESVRALAAAARDAGTALSVEPMREDFRPIRTMISTLAETLDLLEDVGDDSVGMVFDIWHMWDSPGWQDCLAEALPRFHAVQVADYRVPTRGPLDRVVAGAGAAGVADMLRILREHGYSGWFDLEVFSDDGRFGTSYPDSLWKLEPLEFAKRQVDGFLASWQASHSHLTERSGDP